MDIKWEPLDIRKTSPRDLLIFRNRVLKIDTLPSEIEINALENQITAGERDKTQYNLVAFKDNELTAWINGKFAPVRLTDMIRVFFFDINKLTQQGVDDLLYQIEASLPYPYIRIEIYGLGPEREHDLQLIKNSGYSEAFDIVHYRWVSEKRPGFRGNENLFFEHVIDAKSAFNFYAESFHSTWERDSLAEYEFVEILAQSDERLSFICMSGENAAGMVIVNKGLTDDEAYLQIIAINNLMEKKGIGDSMMCYLLEKLFENGIHTLTLSTYSDNHKMVKMMRRWNFTVQSRETVLYKEEVNLN
jgi:ribosomal protein S18 acetylase RimI-like enzyme